MADFNQINQFGSGKPVRTGEGMSCAECEAMLTDAIDGVLSAKDQAAFDLHIATCSECSRMLADAKRGAALLEMLKSPRPEPSAMLFERIIAQTSGVAAGLERPSKSQPADMTVLSVDRMSQDGHSVVAAAATSVAPHAAAAQVPFGMARGNVLPFRSPAGRKFSMLAITHTLMQPRLAMTAAMAFFSIALTLNLTGVHLNQFRASDLKPSSLKRSFYQADASVVRYYDNLRVVYELQTRVRDLQRSNENDTPATGGDAGDGKSGATDGPGVDKDKAKPEQRKSPKAGSGTSQRHNPLEDEFKLASSPQSSSQLRATELASLRRIEFTSNINKLKKELQEGGLV